MKVNMHEAKSQLSKLGEQARKAIADDRNEVYVSAASGWEIAIKRETGKLSAPPPGRHHE